MPGVLDNPESKPGPSRSKGKDIDPRSWGNAGIAPEELDINLQKALLYAYERGRKEAKNRERQPKNRNEIFEEKFNVPTVPRYGSIVSSAQQRANS